MKAKEVVVVNVRIPLTIKMAVKKYVERDTHIDFSDFMRDSIREKLKKDALWILKEALMTEPSARGRITRKYAEYQVEIEGIYEEYIEPIKEKRDEEIETSRERDSNDVDSWQNVCESISSQIWAIEAPYDEQLSKPETDYQKSRNLYAESHFRWLKDNIQRYIELAPETEALCFGLMKGCLMEALKEGEKVRDLIHRAVYWDTKQAYNYMGEDIDGDEVIQVEIWDTLEKLYEEANL